MKSVSNSSSGATICKTLLAALVLVGCGPAAPASSTNAPTLTFTPGLEGTWYVSTPDTRAGVTFSWDQSSGQFSGRFDVEGKDQVSDAVDSVQWASHSLSFRRVGNGFWEWYRGTVEMGVLTGRMVRTTGPDQPDDAGYASHFSAWSSAIDTAIVPRVFDILVNSDSMVRLRIDRDASGLVGRFKRYATLTDAAAAEDLEYDVQISAWDGINLTFTLGASSLSGSYQATVQGRLLSGTAHLAAGDAALSGARAEVLTHGLVDMTPEGRAAWQARARTALVHLLMADNPQPLSVDIQTLQHGVQPLSSSYPYDRDDDPDHWGQSYTLSELQLNFVLPNPHGGADMHRTVHGWLSTPSGPPPAAGYPMAVAVNGHFGSAWDVFNPGDAYYYYGDAYARRGYVVFSIDVSHRPLEDRQQLYADFDTGDDPDHGNGAHPAIKASGYDSDFEEDGERAWDVISAVEAVRNATANLDPNRLLITGLSMGGEVATYVGALDERFPVVIPAGFSPDLSVMAYHFNHDCWRWQHADIREYIDISDLHALIAPRTLLVETGRTDSTFSDLAEPFAGDKQVARRSRSAFADVPGHFVHYLHYDEHHYHFGDLNPSWLSEQDLRVPTRVQPDVLGPTSWQVDSITLTEPSNLFQFTAVSLGPAP